MTFNAIKLYQYEQVVILSGRITSSLPVTIYEIPEGAHFTKVMCAAFGKEYLVASRLQKVAENRFVNLDRPEDKPIDIIEHKNIRRKTWTIDLEFDRQVWVVVTPDFKGRFSLL